METFELRYFVAVARTENVNRAGKELAVSPGSLSKAVARLEAELGVELFQRVGRNIRLTDAGQVLLRRAGAILSLEAATRTELQGPKAALTVYIAGPDLLLARVGAKLVQEIERVHSQARFVFRTADEAETERLVQHNEAHLGLTTASTGSGITAKKLLDTSFQTVVGRGHTLYKAAKAGRVVPIAEVLAFPFVAPNMPILGEVQKAQAHDGWRDDKFPRRLTYVASSLQLLAELVVSGLAIAYLPDYFASELDVEVLKISGCPYTCKQTVRLIGLTDNAWAFTQPLMHKFTV